MPRPSPFRCFKTSPEIIHLAVMMYLRFPLSLRNVDDLLRERGIDIHYGTVRFWWHQFVQKPPKSAVTVLQNSALI
jgi:putative transposase